MAKLAIVPKAEPAILGDMEICATVRELTVEAESLAARVDAIIDAGFAGAGSKQQVAAVRQCEIDTRARGYGYLTALRVFQAYLKGQRRWIEE